MGKSPKSPKPKKVPAKRKTDKELHIGGSEKKDSFALQEFHPFKPKHYQFLIEFQKDLDMERALKASGFGARAGENFLDPDTPFGRQMSSEIMAIQKEFAKGIKLHAKWSASKLVEYMEKIEADYENSDLETRAKFASTMARFADTALKATGQYASKGVDKGTRVEINIDLSGEGNMKRVDDIIEVKLEEE